ncbi:MAG: methylmalonyl-CoA mutase family protein [Gemmatimonadales bacterium]|jgi:methylmalonyl-CoA mutase N-terminal domain/subunit
MGTGERRERFETPSGIELERLYGPDEVPIAYDADLGDAGSLPFTRGIHPTMYRGRLWTMRQYAGFGTAEETNARFRYLLESGQTGLSIAFDLPTQMGYDSDDPMAEGEVGRVGVAIDTLDDMRRLFEGIPLDRVSTSMTINATAPILLALYVALADERGTPRSSLRGTVQNDILKEFVARGTYIYPVEASLRLVTELFAFCAADVPKWNPISISGYHMREAGATATQEIAFTLANGREYIRCALGAGLALDDFAPRLSFFFASHNNFLEEVAKFRAARRLWARIIADMGGSEASCRLRFHTQTGGSTLTAQQPYNNVVRVAVQALAAVLGGTQSLHTNSYDEALALPSEDAARLALRTQQILAAESGVADTVDPLGGSWAIEALTDELEARAEAYIRQIDEVGGASRAIGFMGEEIHRSAYEYQRALEASDVEVVGVNVNQEVERPLEVKTPDYAALAEAQKSRLRDWKENRAPTPAAEALDAVRAAAASEANLMPPLVAAVKAGVTLGEISGELRRVWGTYEKG